MKQFTTAILGLGARGLDTYAPYAKMEPSVMKIVAVADIDQNRVNAARKKYDLDPKLCFGSAEEFLKQPKLADLIILATQDQQHFDMAEKALRLGYDILLEKPISPILSECVRLRDIANELNRSVIVCHVLRYTKFYQTIKEILDSKRLGEIASIQAIENVGYWHMAHSFVRGNWRNHTTTSPMILQKCCHDFDIISWLIGKRCLRLSSYGSLKYFNNKNAPKGNAAFCVNAKECKKDCPYDAEKIYLEHSEIGFKNGNVTWPINVLTLKPTAESVKLALAAGPYGRCVFRCDNDVVDHQVVQMEFEQDITVSFTMSGFTSQNSRQIKIMCTKGEVDADMGANIIKVTPFGKSSEIIDVNKLTDDLSGHGGGDNEMMRQLFETLQHNPQEGVSSIDASVHSHVIAFAAEHSRKNNGESIEIDKFEQDALKENPLISLKRTAN